MAIRISGTNVWKHFQFLGVLFGNSGDSNLILDKSRGLLQSGGDFSAADLYFNGKRHGLGP
jgi:hypothetical protein